MGRDDDETAGQEEGSGGGGIELHGGVESVVILVECECFQLLLLFGVVRGVWLIVESTGLVVVKQASKQAHPPITAWLVERESHPDCLFQAMLVWETSFLHKDNHCRGLDWSGLDWTEQCIESPILIDVRPGMPTVLIV